ncbi:hypothetical protein KHA80_04095 [Anaerobacillus sp. HL2]|nr:hypothetical protein KHA80_04095 [Anaerobacillus sp. HL2]
MIKLTDIEVAELNLFFSKPQVKVIGIEKRTNVTRRGFFSESRESGSEMNYFVNLVINENVKLYSSRGFALLSLIILMNLLVVVMKYIFTDTNFTFGITSMLVPILFLLLIFVVIIVNCCWYCF